ncbi:Tubulin/FtsZ family, GTPase domain protein, partial [Opisthorchis viverrini]
MPSEVTPPHFSKLFVREVIILSFGQAGTQLSNAAWELLCLEHGIKPDGLLFDSLNPEDCLNNQTFFQDTPTGQQVPRAVIMDLEPTVIDEIRTGVYRGLFHPDQLITSIEDASNNYARGFYSVGRRVVKRYMSQVRRATEACDMFQGFFVINSFGGGTGSGFTSLALNHLDTEFAKRSKIQVGIYPGPRLSTGIVEPYNSVLTFNSSMEQSELSILLDNESLYDLCDTGLGVPRPTYTDVNRIVAIIFSCMTVSLRFESSLNADLTQLETNLVPYPRIHFPIVSHAPITSSERSEHEVFNTSDLTRLLFEPTNQMLNVDLSQGRIMSCCIQYRGDIAIQDVAKAVMDMKCRQTLRFVDWCPTGFKLGVASQPPTIPSYSPMAKTTRSATLLMNTSAVNQAIQKVDRKFDMLFHKRAFVHWYVSEGMEEGEFPEAREALSILEQDYLGVTQELSQKEPHSNPRTMHISTQEELEQPEDMMSNSERGRQTSSNHAIRWSDVARDEESSY